MGRDSIKYTFNQLVNLGAFIGHLVRRSNNFMTLYFYGVRCGLVCFNLSYTAYYMRRAGLFFLSILNYRGCGYVLCGDLNPIHLWFLNTVNRLTEDSIYWYAGPLMGGLVSNFYSIRHSLNASKVSSLGGFSRFPSVALIFDSNEYFNCYREAFNVGLPSIGLVDSDLEYKGVSYPLFMNNETFRIKFFFCTFFYNLVLYSCFFERLFLLECNEKVVNSFSKKFLKITEKNFQVLEHKNPYNRPCYDYYTLRILKRYTILGDIIHYRGIR